MVMEEAAAVNTAAQNASYALEEKPMRWWELLGLAAAVITIGRWLRRAGFLSNQTWPSRRALVAIGVGLVVCTFGTSLLFRALGWRVVRSTPGWPEVCQDAAKRMPPGDARAEPRRLVILPLTGPGGRIARDELANAIRARGEYEIVGSEEPELSAPTLLEDAVATARVLHADLVLFGDASVGYDAQGRRQHDLRVQMADAATGEVRWGYSDSGIVDGPEDPAAARGSLSRLATALRRLPSLALRWRLLVLIGVVLVGGVAAGVAVRALEGRGIHAEILAPVALSVGEVILMSLLAVPDWIGMVEDGIARSNMLDPATQDLAAMTKLGVGIALGLCLLFTLGVVNYILVSIAGD